MTYILEEISCASCIGYFSTAPYNKGKGCSRHSINQSVVEDILLDAIKRHIEHVAKLDELLTLMKENEACYDDVVANDREILAKYQELEQCKNEVGNYIEKIFPLLDVRFIAVNNSFDSKDYKGTTPDMDVAFENLMYDYFSKENSVKIKNDLMGRRKRGKYLATFAAFGYKKSPTDHNHIVIDEEAAAIVHMIFEKYAECGIKAEVARYLNQKDIPTPQIYAVKSGSTYQWKYQGEKRCGMALS